VATTGHLIALKLLARGEQRPQDEIDLRGLSARIREEAMSLQERVPEILVEIEHGTRVLGVEGEIYSAISNLVFNAVRYTLPEGSIRVSWDRLPDGGGRLSVIDTGIGIEAKYIPLLTQRFYRVSRSRARHKGGSGLGLAIVKHVMQRHGGTLEIESTPGKGSSFHCLFPAERVIRRAQRA
jgi:two-component system, OmpR family, phosphate regulon sensor histidine kinase PhoR